MAVARSEVVVRDRQMRRRPKRSEGDAIALGSASPSLRFGLRRIFSLNAKANRMFEALAFSEVGGHSRNEDAYLFRSHPLDENCWLCCIADGQGGRAGGERAAQVACESVIELACRTSVKELSSARSWIDVLKHADQFVAADAVAGFTTLVGYCINHSQIVGASNGDSAVLLMSGGVANIPTERQRKNPPIGSGDAIVTGFSAALGDNWRVLAMTDGVWKYVGWERVIELAQLHSVAELLSGLQELARLPGSGEFQDDFTVVALQKRARGGAYAPR
jgi:serine/threonine protein phosphatase PrpC